MTPVPYDTGHAADRVRLGRARETPLRTRACIPPHGPLSSLLPLRHLPFCFFFNSLTLTLFLFFCPPTALLSAAWPRGATRPSARCIIHSAESRTGARPAGHPSLTGARPYSIVAGCLLTSTQAYVRVGSPFYAGVPPLRWSRRAPSLDGQPLRLARPPTPPASARPPTRRPRSSAAADPRGTHPARTGTVVFTPRAVTGQAAAGRADRAAWQQWGTAAAHSLTARTKCPRPLRCRSPSSTLSPRSAPRLCARARVLVGFLCCNRASAG